MDQVLREQFEESTDFCADVGLDVTLWECQKGPVVRSTHGAFVTQTIIMYKLPNDQVQKVNMCFVAMV